MIRSRCFLLLLLVIGVLQASAQGIAINQWRDHFPYQKGLEVADAGTKVYCMTLGGLFSYDKTDNSITRYSKVNGLSDVDFSAIGYNSYNGTTIIAYKNANLDLITSDGNIINIADIKRASIIGNKTINSVYFENQYAYLSCGFGIVVLDTDRKEIKDTYYIGPGGSYINVLAVTTVGGNIYAAARDGVYHASMSAPLSNYNSWAKFSGLPNGVYNTITAFNGKVYVNYSKVLTSNLGAQDSIFVYDNNAWTLFPAPLGYSITHLRSTPTKLVVSHWGDVSIYDANNTLSDIIYTYTFAQHLSPSDAVIDVTGKVWIADQDWGLVEALNSWSNSYHLPNSPAGAKGKEVTGVFRMASAPNTICFVPGNVTDIWTGSNLFGAFYRFSDEVWSTADAANNPSFYSPLTDFVSVAIDPLNTQKSYVGTWGSGLIEFNGNTVSTIYNTGNTNGALSSHWNAPGWAGIGGLAFDSDNNLWMTVANTGNSRGIAVKKADGTWLSYSLAPYINKDLALSSIVVNKLNQKWVVIPRAGGLLVFDETRPAGSQVKKLSTSTGNGALPSNEVMCVAEDKDGQMWVGTDKGIGVFYSPELMFNSSGFDAQQIIIQQDGHYQILLETELINAITVDGGNRKWIATQNSGVFLMSADGSTEIYHFDITNSPLPSNEVTAIAIDPATGEVFFGTQKGVVSFKGTATEGSEEYQQVYAFPNPVQPGYEGLIAIRGLVTDAEVRITDISGNLVSSMKADGGQAVWNGRTLKGEKVRSGVYMVFCSSADGSQTFATKIVVIN
jgi:hypothetical protein